MAHFSVSFQAIDKPCEMICGAISAFLPPVSFGPGSCILSVFLVSLDLDALVVDVVV
jgi:hypothetical protein